MKWQGIKDGINSYQRFLITTHVNPDGDGIGAASALVELLLQKHKQVRFVCDSPIPRKFHFLDFHHSFEMYNPCDPYDQVEVLIVLDTHRRDRIGRLAQLIDKPGVITLCIDHHEVADPFTRYLAVDPKACSVGAMVYSFFKECGEHINLHAATGIYASIVCDTGRFSYSSTSRKAHKIAEECIKMGVDPDHIYSQLFQHVSFNEIKLFASALQRMETYLDNKVVVEQIRKEDCLHVGASNLDLEHADLEYIHDFNNLIEDVQCVILLREIETNKIRVSLRSKTDIDVSHIVRELGGGGHPNAAGLTWTGSMDEIKQILIQHLSELFNKKSHCIHFVEQERVS